MEERTRIIEEINTAAGTGQAEPGAIGAHGEIRTAQHAEVSARRDARVICEDKTARLERIIGEAQAREIEQVDGAIIDFNPIRGSRNAGNDFRAMGVHGKDFINHERPAIWQRAGNDRIRSSRRPSGGSVSREDAERDGKEP